MKYVRLKPFNPKEGHLYRRLTVRSKRMIAGRWYRVDDGFAKSLEAMHQPRPPGQRNMAKTTLAFDVAATKKEAEGIERASKPKAPVEAAADLTTGDLKATDLTTKKAEEKPKARRSRRSSG